MSARILVVDDLAPNVKLLEARLSAEYFDVATATNGADALSFCQNSDCDLVLMDVMMPGMDGFEATRRLKADAATAHIPVVMVTALDQPADRVRGLDAGADDFLTKPVDEVALLARVRSLTRMKMAHDELRQRATSTAALGVTGAIAVTKDRGEGAAILLVDDRESSSEKIVATLRDLHRVDLQAQPSDALIKGVEGQYDLFIVSLGLRDYDALRLCSQLRSVERTRQIPILLIADIDDRQRVLRGLDLGVNDYLSRPIDRNELVARVRTQVKRKRYADNLRESLQSSLEMAVVDALTGLNNRRYFDTHAKTMLGHAAGRNKALSMMILDLDHFKSVNDTYGHDVGDEVLRVFANRVKQVIRSGDLMCRLGGEEFIIVLPDTPLAVAEQVAERVRSAVCLQRFPIEQGQRTIAITVSIGLADRGRDSDPAAMLKRADQALYRSKHGGRNMVSAAAA